MELLFAYLFEYQFQPYFMLEIKIMQDFYLLKLHFAKVNQHQDRK